MLHVHIDGRAAGLDRDVHFVCVYMLHATSTQRDPDAWLQLTAKLQSLPKEHHIMLLGDLNTSIASHSPVIFPPHTVQDPFVCVSPYVCERASADKAVSQYRADLLDLCSSMDLCVLNGMKRLNDRDMCCDGSFTFSSKNRNKNSVVDYMCCNYRCVCVCVCLMYVLTHARCPTTFLLCRTSNVCVFSLREVV
jgi:hypothetical protein